MTLNKVLKQIEVLERRLSTKENSIGVINQITDKLKYLNVMRGSWLKVSVEPAYSNEGVFLGFKSLGYYMNPERQEKKQVLGKYFEFSINNNDSKT